eukprot:scaffold3569_cov112-Isochrysis_galbana.AAC.1
MVSTNDKKHYAALVRWSEQRDAGGQRPEVIRADAQCSRRRGPSGAARARACAGEPVQQTLKRPKLKLRAERPSATKPVMLRVGLEPDGFEEWLWVSASQRAHAPLPHQATQTPIALG